jgi:hypothetical protein
MNLSAFGVEDGRISKAERKPASGGRTAAGMLFPGYHGALVGKPGKKLRSVGNELGGNIGGGLVGATAGRLIARKNPAVGTMIGAQAGGLTGGGLGTRRAHRRGYYKPER